MYQALNRERGQFSNKAKRLPDSSDDQSRARRFSRGQQSFGLCAIPEPNESVQISPRNRKFLRSKRFIAIALSNGIVRKLDFVIAQHAFERSRGQRFLGVARVEVLKHIRQIRRLDVLSLGHNKGALDYVLELANVAGP